MKQGSGVYCTVQWQKRRAKTCLGKTKNIFCLLQRSAKVNTIKMRSLSILAHPYFDFSVTSTVCPSPSPQPSPLTVDCNVHTGFTCTVSFGLFSAISFYLSIDHSQRYAVQVFKFGLLTSSVDIPWAIKF